MTARQSLSKSTRFEVFKRDAFTCQYCGRHPPAVVLEVDHVIAVSAGGSSDDHNLITSCFDCNRGKGAKALGAVALDVSEKAAIARERREQVRAYERLLAKIAAEQDKDVNRVIAAFTAAFEGWTLHDGARPSIRRFLTKLPPSEVIEAMSEACWRIGREKAFRYFCGICWRKIKGD